MRKLFKNFYLVPFLAVLMLVSTLILPTLSNAEKTTKNNVAVEAEDGSRIAFNNIFMSTNLYPDKKTNNQLISNVTENVSDNTIERVVTFDQLHSELTIEVSLELKEGSYIALGTDDQGYSDGAALILNENDESIGLLSTPQFSPDSNVNIKKAELKDDNTVSLLIETNHSEESTDMILRLSSTWYNDYFSGGAWIVRDGKDSLSLTHKPFLLSGSTNEKILKQADSWSKVKTRHSPSHRWYNEGGLSDQYSCHYGYAAYKNPWNIEPWRPNVGITRTILAACNPS